MRVSLPRKAVACTISQSLLESFDELLAMEAKRGIDLVLSGEFEGIKVAYLATDRDLGVILEIFSGMPSLERKPDAT